MEEKVKTGESAPKAGRYRGESSGKEIIMSQGEKAPSGNDGSEETYTLIEENK